MGIVLRARGTPVPLRAVLVIVLRARVPPYLYGELFVAVPAIMVTFVLIRICARVFSRRSGIWYLVSGIWYIARQRDRDTDRAGVVPFPVWSSTPCLSQYTAVQ